MNQKQRRILHNSVTDLAASNMDLGAADPVLEVPGADARCSQIVVEVSGCGTKV